jgi:hypothetical protein
MAPGILFDDQVSGSFGQYNHSLRTGVLEWPRLFTSGLTWEPASFCDEQSYTYSIAAPEIQEVENALEHFKCKLGTL